MLVHTKSLFNESIRFISDAARILQADQLQFRKMVLFVLHLSYGGVYNHNRGLSELYLADSLG